jgi:hypothetical protein
VGRGKALIEIACIVFIGVIARSHYLRMKALGQQARDYGKTTA